MMFEKIKPLLTPEGVLLLENADEAIRLAIVAEQDAIKLYQLIAQAVEDRDIAKVMLDIADEEQVHVGELQELLERFDGDERELIEKGKGEVREMLSTEMIERLIKTADELEKKGYDKLNVLLKEAIETKDVTFSGKTKEEINEQIKQLKAKYPDYKVIPLGNYRTAPDDPEKRELRVRLVKG
jgi:rubrerythrin